MSVSRKLLLWGSQNKWMKQNIPKLFFVKKALRKFMPGENIEDAVAEALTFKKTGIETVFTKLGENISTLADAEEVTAHYLEVLSKIEDGEVSAEISLKLTQIGIDISEDAAQNNFEQIIKLAAEKNNFIWIDMEQSSYTERTIEFYKHFRIKYRNTGLCLQAYLKRTINDINELLPIKPNIRLVKGAYMEPPDSAYPQKSLVDKNYYELSRILLNYTKENRARIAFATHDTSLIAEIKKYALSNNIPAERFEFQMLYGIKTGEQFRTAKEGYGMRVLISYGDAWYSWYMRRLAERPANVWFVLKNIYS
jgi:proline dehydrogenase